MFDLHTLFLPSKCHQGWHHRWCYFIHKRRNQTICSSTEREASQRSQNSWCDGLCELGIFLKWCSSAHQGKGEEGVFSKRGFVILPLKVTAGSDDQLIPSERDVSIQMHSHLIPGKEQGTKGGVGPTQAEFGSLSLRRCVLFSDFCNTKFSRAPSLFEGFSKTAG